MFVRTCSLVCRGARRAEVAFPTRTPATVPFARFSEAIEITPKNKELLTAKIGRNYRHEMELSTCVLPEDHGPPHATRVSEMPSTYTRAVLLEDLQRSDVGKWYHCREEDLEKMPAGVKHTFRELFEATLTNHVMIRKKTFDLIQFMKEIEAVNVQPEWWRKGSGRSVGLHGPRGCSKSVNLGLCAQYAIQNNWLVIGFKAEDLVGDKFGFIEPSETRTGTFKQDRYCREWCKLMMTEQGNKLRRIKLKRNYDHYTWKSPDYGPEALGLVCESQETLYDLCKQAAINTSTAAEVVYDFVEELKLVEDSEPRVLVLMDNINVWDNPAGFRDPENPFKRLDPWKLSMVDAFSYFVGKGPANGLSVWALACSGYATLVKGNVHLASASIAVRNDIYTDNELVAAASHFKVSNVISSEVDQFLLARIKGLTGNVPKDVFFDAVLI